METTIKESYKDYRVYTKLWEPLSQVSTTGVFNGRQLTAGHVMWTPALRNKQADYGVKMRTPKARS